MLWAWRWTTLFLFIGTRRHWPCRRQRYNGMTSWWRTLALCRLKSSATRLFGQQRFNSIHWDEKAVSPDIHWRRWRHASMSSVNTKAATLTTFPFLCRPYFRAWCDPRLTSCCSSHGWRPPPPGCPRVRPPRLQDSCYHSIHPSQSNQWSHRGNGGDRTAQRRTRPCTHRMAVCSSLQKNRVTDFHSCQSMVIAPVTTHSWAPSCCGPNSPGHVFCVTVRTHDTFIISIRPVATKRIEQCNHKNYRIVEKTAQTSVRNFYFISIRINRIIHVLWLVVKFEKRVSLFILEKSLLIDKEKNATFIVPI